MLLHAKPSEAVASSIRYLLVGEYQDTNYIQEQLLVKLAGDAGNLCVVGDEDQSLYRFRGATVRNVLEKEGYILVGKVDLLLGGDGKLELLTSRSRHAPPTARRCWTPTSANSAPTPTSWSSAGDAVWIACCSAGPRRSAKRRR